LPRRTIFLAKGLTVLPQNAIIQILRNSALRNKKAAAGSQPGCDLFFNNMNNR
jgi:hypothetical protein